MIPIEMCSWVTIPHLSKGLCFLIVVNYVTLRKLYKISVYLPSLLYHLYSQFLQFLKKDLVLNLISIIPILDIVIGVNTPHSSMFYVSFSKRTLRYVGFINQHDNDFLHLSCIFTV